MRLLRLKCMAGAELEALRPEGRAVEERHRACGTYERTSGAGNRGIAGQVERGVDLVAGTQHIAHVQEIVAGKQANATLQAVAYLQLRFGRHGKLVASLLPDIRELREDAARGRRRRPGKACGCRESIDAEGLIVVAECDLRQARSIEWTKLLLGLCANLNSEELVPGREAVRSHIGAGKRRQQVFGADDREALAQINVTDTCQYRDVHAS